MMRKADDAEGEDAGTRAFATSLDGLVFAEDAETVQIEVCRDGKWSHPKFGEIKVDKGLRESFAQSFSADVRKVGQLPLDYDHERGPAPGWITGLRNQGSSLFADVKLTPTGKEKIQSGEYRFFSPEWHPAWKDPETGKSHGPTLFGGGLTNRPFFRGMAAITCSEPEGEKPAGEPAPSGEGNDKGDKPEGTTMDKVEDKAAKPAGSEADKPAGENVQASEQEGTITAEEVRQLREEVQSLRATEDERQLTHTFSEMRFNEGCQVITPASRTALVKAVLPLSADQRRAVLDAVKGVQLVQFGEVGFEAGEPAEKAGMSEERKKQLLGATPLGAASMKRG